MRSRPTTLAVTVALVAGVVVAPAVSAAPVGPRLSEIRIDQPGTDLDEYVEVEAPPGTVLDGLALVAIGDGAGGSGVVESVVDLEGSVDASGAFVVAEDTFSLGIADLVAELNHENSDNVTHLLVEGLTVASGDDLDTDDDGTLDVEPWESVVDAVGLVESPAGGDAYYGAALGFTDVGPDGSFVPGHVLRDGDGVWSIGAYDPDGGDDTPGVVPNVAPVAPAACDADEITLVSTVQGSGWYSPLAGDPRWSTGDPVTVRGVVTLAADSLDGFFVQEEAADQDDDAATSEGVYVRGELPVGAGEGSTVEVTGGVREDFDRTQVEAEEVAWCDDIAPIDLPATELVLPADAAAREALEAMKVVTTQDLSVTSLYTAYEFGELGVALGGPLAQPTSRYAPDDPRAAELLEEQADRLLYIDDRNEFGDSNAPWFDAQRGRAGDLVERGVVGVLFYSFGDHLLEPVGAFPTITRVEERPAAPELQAGNDVGAFNVLNYFNDLDGRGARSEAQLEQQTAKIVDAITALDAAVLGLVELENDYGAHYDDDPDTVPAVADLVAALNERAGEDRWAWVVPDEDDLVDGGIGPDEIAVGIVYQPDRATEVGDPATFDIDHGLREVAEGNDDFSNADKNRWPLAQTFRVNGRDLTVAVNHLKSKGSSCAFVSGPDFEAGEDVGTALTGNCDLTRTYAAEQLAQWLDQQPTGVDTDQAFVVGDLNAYDEEAPIHAFEEAGWTDLVEALGGDAATYKFDGRYGRLDYVLASPAALGLVRDAQVWQANSAEPYGYLYYLDPVDDSAYASSDHDPVVVSIQPQGRPARVLPPVGRAG